MANTVVRPKRCPTCGHVLGAREGPLTRTQAQLLRFLGEHITREGCAPTLDEMRRNFQWKSSATPAMHLDALEHKGYIRRGARGAARGITILVPFDEIGTVPVERHHG